MIPFLRIRRLTLFVSAILLFGVHPLRAADVYEGILQIAWQDPRPGSTLGGETHYSLALADGRIVGLQMNGHEAEAMALTGTMVTVSGQPGAARTAAFASAAATMVVEAIAPARALSSSASTAAIAIGTKKVIFVLLKFADDAAVPHAPAFYTDLTNPDTAPAGQGIPATLNAFFKKTSNNQFSWAADVGGAGGVGAPGGWIALPQPKNYYAPCNFSASCANLVTLTTDSIAAAKAQGIVFTPYDNINFVYSNDLDCCATGGNWTFDGKTYGTTWEPPWGQNTVTYAHEMGHSLGLRHSGWVYFSYDSPWDIMSGTSSINQLSCGSYVSRNGGSPGLSCGEPGDGYIAMHREYLGWIPAANSVVTDTTSTITVTLEAAALPLGGGVKLVKVCLPGLPCTGSSAQYVTVEARVKGGAGATQYDNGIPGEGIILHDVRFGRPAISGSCFFNNQSGWAVPIDTTPGDYDIPTCSRGTRVFPAWGLNNAQLTAGQTFTSGTYPLRISVLARIGSTFTVSIGPPTTSAPLVTAQPSNTTVFTGQPVVLTSAAAGSPSPSAQWQSSVNGGSSWVNISGATDANLSFAPQRADNGKWYRCLFTNAAGSAATNAAIMLVRLRVRADVDGDRRADLALWTPGTGTWSWLTSGTGYAGAPLQQQWGNASLDDRPIGGDLDGDGLADPVVWRASTGTWLWLTSSSGYATAGSAQWGNRDLGDVPLAGDVDGDGRADLIVWRASTGTFYWLLSSRGYDPAQAGSKQWGNQGLGDVPLLGDFDGDGLVDLAVWRASSGTWFWLTSGSGYNYAASGQKQWGNSGLGDLPLVADIDGDGVSDLVIWRASTGTFYWLTAISGYSYAGAQAKQWGNQAQGDVPMLGDIDGDTVADLVIWRATTGTWYWLTSSSGFSYASPGARQWGAAGDVPMIR
ncbi:MAG TPA: FG-GAP-like repeat-containing protein [Vicinamibacterales bacterium]|nr:FG-GAP-like repeat-containing protein [Vicinamibacterales bacterium]